jgi:hypothetical protein
LSHSARRAGRRSGIPGTYYELCVPAVAKTEWHPFSLTTSELATHEEFLLKDLGQWTTKVGQLLGDKDRNLAKEMVLIRGGSLAQNSAQSSIFFCRLFP